MARRKIKYNWKKIVLWGLLGIIGVILIISFMSIGLAKKVLPGLAAYTDKSPGRTRGFADLKSSLDWAKVNPYVQPERTKWSKAIYYSPLIAWVQGKITGTY